MLLFDLGDAVRYESHPEIAIENAYGTAERGAGAMPGDGTGSIPASHAHDAWLGPYSRILSTPVYYEVPTLSPR